MIKRLVLAAVVLAATLCLPTTTSAAPLVSINPTFQAGNIGDVFSVDIVVSGLEGKAVGSFDLDITFDNVILVGQSFAFGGGLGGPGDVMDLSNGFLGGSIDLAVVSLLSASDLLTLQGGATFTLGTLTFLGATNGLSPLNITQFVFADGDGNALPVGVGNGSIQVGDATPIPEPGTLVLLATGAGVTAWRHRRQQRRR